MDAIFKLLCSKTKLERDQGVTDIRSYLQSSSYSADEFQCHILHILKVVENKEWETLLGGLLAAKEFLLTADADIIDFSTFSDSLIVLLDHDESRVRLSAGEVFGILSLKGGIDVYSKSKDIIISKIMDNFDRRSESIDGDHGAHSPLQEIDVHEVFEQRASAFDIFHDTAGWKHLETWIKCLQCVIEATGATFCPYIDDTLMELISNSLGHRNRFVRETGHFVCGCLAECGNSQAYLDQFGDQLASNIARGLSDNWSQVRMAASVAVRKFLLNMQTEDREKYLSILLPPLCLNRYYIAEGVRVYSQTTWQKLFSSDGKSFVEKHIASVVPFYISQTKADNHAVREAACACIAELGSKIDKQVMSEHVAALLEALITCFHDDSWPVRDSACVACGNFIASFPVETKDSLDQLYPLFYENLSDSIQSVRQGAARSLCSVTQAYGEEALTFVLCRLESGLKGINDQPASSGERLSPIEREPAQFGVIKRIPGHVVDAAHTDKQMYSCGSLAPKMHAASARNEGTDHLFKKPFQPWFLTDGCIWLFGEIAKLGSCSPKLIQHIHLLAEAGAKRDYEDHVYLLESLFRQLPVIAKGVGKRVFKQYLELFYDTIFYGLSCDNALAEAAANDCLIQLANLLGPNILRGRVEMYNPSYSGLLDRVIVGQPFLP